MHEMAMTQDVLKIVLQHAEKGGAKQVVSVSLRIGELRDIVDEWMQRFFDYLTHGTIAAEAKLKIKRLPIVFRCECGETFPTNIKLFMGNLPIVCPNCKGEKTVLYSGREFEIQSIEVK
ncbi:MAG: hydrogenase maturation nickel metallochaperone HypA [Desulfobacterium sp.]